MGPHPLMSSFGLMVDMSKNLKLFLNPTRYLSGSSRNTRQSLGLSNLCHLIAAVCGHLGNGEYLEHSVLQPQPGALPAARTRAQAGAGSAARFALAGRGTPAQTEASTSVGAATGSVFKREKNSNEIIIKKKKAHKVKLNSK